jgi:putative adenylate-forming enzyme
MTPSRLSVVRAFVQTRLAHARLRTRSDIDRHHARLWRKLAPALQRTPALGALAGAPLHAFPVTNASDLRADLGAWNSLGLSDAAIRQCADAAERGENAEMAPGVRAGFSTGSQGARGAFITNAEERARYLGQILAKLLPRPMLRRWRIALCLRANNALYQDVSRAGPFTFAFLPLTLSGAQKAQTLAAFQPDILIAPSHVLVALAADTAAVALKISLERLFYGAEPMGGREREWIAERLGARPDPIYQATEGFLGAACAAGRLHLNEDSIAFEYEPIAGSNRVRPIITDLRRTSQPIVRLRLDDLMVLTESPCPCRSPMAGIEPIEGRFADIWRFGDRMIFPGDVEACISAATPPQSRWRALAAPESVTLMIEPDLAENAHAALRAMLARAGVSAPVTISAMREDPAPKRRRVRWAHG